MAVFFRFGEGVARSNKEPQKLFKLLDMFDSLEKLKTEFSEIFEGEAGADICTRFRELEKLLVHSSSKVFWEFGLQIEGNSDGFPPPQDGSVSKLVRYSINYLQYLASETYSAPMAKVLLTEKLWKAGILSKPEPGELTQRCNYQHHGGTSKECRIEKTALQGQNPAPSICHEHILVHLHENKKHGTWEAIRRAVLENELQGCCRGISLHVSKASLETSCEIA